MKTHAREDGEHWVLNGSKTYISNGILADVAPTLLDLMEIEQPKEMTGRSLIG